MAGEFHLSRIGNSSVSFSFLFSPFFRGLCCFFREAEPGFVLEDGSRCLRGLGALFLLLFLFGRCVSYFTCLCAACGAYK